MFKNFFSDRRANMALMLAGMAPVVLALVGLAADTAMLARNKSNMQNATDAAALATTKELLIPGVTQERIESVFKQSFFANFDIASEGEKNFVIKVERDPKVFALSARVEYHWKPFIAQMVDRMATPVVSFAKAQMAADGMTCLIGLLQPSPLYLVKSSLHFGNNSKLAAENCGVFSNSDHIFVLRADGAAEISAQMVCSAGGVLRLGKAKFTPEPVKDCPVIEDPLAKRIAPSVGACSEHDPVINAQHGVTTTIKPGVYCGGLTISGEGTVKLDQGVYIIKDGPLTATGSVSVKGKGVGFYLTGLGSVFNFGKDTAIDLSAPTTGPLAGLLMFEDRNVPHSFNLNPLTY